MQPLHASLAALALLLTAAPAAQAGDLRTAINVQLVRVPASRGETPAPGSGAAAYPPAARQAGIEGSAVVRCDALQNGDFANCNVLEEDPAGHGFGAAALTLIPRLAEAPLGPDAANDAVIPFLFTLKDDAHAYLEPKQIRWAARPEGGVRLSNFYPDQAAHAPLEGYVIVDCGVAADGVLTACRGLVGTPYGWGFKENAVALASQFRLEPRLADGRPIPDGARIRIPIRFRTDAPPKGKGR